jgi:transcriptional regulator with XRE-family HTH domain
MDLAGLGERLRKARSGAGLKPAKLARLAQVNQSYLSRLERGKTIPDPDRVRLGAVPRLAKVLGIALEELIGEDGSDALPLPLLDETREARALHPMFDMTPEETTILFPLIRVLLTLLRNGTPGRMEHVANQLAMLITNTKAPRENPDIAQALDAIAAFERRGSPQHLPPQKLRVSRPRRQRPSSA